MENIYQYFVHELKVCSPVTSCVLPAMPSTPLTRYPWWHRWCVPQNLDSMHDHMGRLSDGRGVRFLESLKISAGFENQWFHNCIKHTHTRTHARTHAHTHTQRSIGRYHHRHHHITHTPTHRHVWNGGTGSDFRVTPYFQQAGTQNVKCAVCFADGE